MHRYNNKIYGGLVWVVSGLALLSYGILGLIEADIPGVQDIILFVNSAEGSYLFVAAFVTIFIEGLYFLGSFFPGTSMVLLITIFAQSGGYSNFILSITTVFMGWTLAGAVNIAGARYFSGLVQIAKPEKDVMEQNAEITWFPAFRANTEVAQVAEGHQPLRVFLSSTLIKFYASVGLGIYALVIPLFIDLQAVNNKQGFIGLAVLSLVNIGVGIYKMREVIKKPEA